MPEILDEKPVEEVTKPTLIDRVKQWPISVALATGIAIGGAGTYEMTADKYDEAAVIQTASDSLDAVKNVVRRPVAAANIQTITVGDEVRLVVFVNDKIYYEQNQTVVNPPIAPNDGFTATARLYIYEDKLKADSTETKPEIQ